MRRLTITLLFLLCFFSAMPNNYLWHKIETRKITLNAHIIYVEKGNKHIKVDTTEIGKLLFDSLFLDNDARRKEKYHVRIYEKLTPHNISDRIKEKEKKRFFDYKIYPIDTVQITKYDSLFEMNIRGVYFQLDLTRRQIFYQSQNTFLSSGNYDLGTFFVLNLFNGVDLIYGNCNHVLSQAEEKFPVYLDYTRYFIFLTPTPNSVAAP